MDVSDMMRHMVKEKLVDGEDHEGPYYLRNPFKQEPDFGVASSNYGLADLLSLAVAT